jgi:hypothetical protein
LAKEDLKTRLLTEARVAFRKYRATMDPRYLRKVADIFDNPDLFSLLESQTTRVVQLAGWAGIPGTGVGLGAIEIVPVPSRVDFFPLLLRKDVASAFGDSSLEKSGFRAVCTYTDFPRRISVFAHLSDGQRLELRPTNEIRVVSGDLLTSPEQIRTPVVGYLDGIEFVSSRERKLGSRRSITNRTSKRDDMEIAVLFGRFDIASTIHSNSFLALQPMGVDPHLDSLRFACGIEASCPESSNYRVRKVEPVVGITKSSQRVLLPHSHSDLDTTIEVPTPTVIKIENCSIIHGGLIENSDGNILLDDLASHPKYDYVAGRWSTAQGSFLRFSEGLYKNAHGTTIELDVAATLLGRVPFNYFHSLIEYVARIETLIRNGYHEKIPLLVNSNLCPGSLEALELLVDKKNIFHVDADSIIRVNQLLVPTFHTNHRDSTIEPWWKGAAFHWPTLLSFRNRILDKVQPVSDTRRIFLKREANTTSARGLANSKQLSKVALDFGFEVVDPGALSFTDQVRLIHSASVIVGAGGAAFANLLFARSDAQVVGLVSDQLSDFAIHSNIARHVGAKFSYLTGPSAKSISDIEYHREWFHLDFEVSVRKFRRTLAELVR